MTYDKISCVTEPDYEYTKERYKITVRNLTGEEADRLSSLIRKLEMKRDDNESIYN